ncbi:MAG: tetratricopeptide repeat protein [Desulfovibrio sp.]
MSASAKAIKEHIARAKNYAMRKDYLRCLGSLCHALDLTTRSQVFGRDKFEISSLLDEALRIFATTGPMKKVFPDGIKYNFGEERQLRDKLQRLHDNMQERIRKAQIEKIRKKKAELDGLLITGQEALQNGEPLEARKRFRRAVEKFQSEEPGLFVNVGNRLMKGGLYAEAVEYFERGMEVNERDGRPYSGLIKCYEALHEIEKVEEYIRITIRNFGANASLWLKLAKIYCEKRDWSEAYDAAKAALEMDPTNGVAKKIAKEAGDRIFL